MGFSPNQPYKVATQLAITNRCLAFQWPSLSELNVEIAPYRWESKEERQRYLDEISIIPLPSLLTRPPPAAPTHTILAIPSIFLLVAAIVCSTDRLFFVSCKFGDNDARQWRLACVAFMDWMSLYPSCALDGRFLFEFYICHPADWRYNAINQHYWLQLHSRSDLASPHSTTDTHLSDWDVLHRHSLMFNNPVQRFDVPTYSVHCNRGAHMTLHDDTICAILMIDHSRTSITEDIYRGPRQKVSCPAEVPPPSFFLWHPLWVPYAFCGISATSFHIALPGDIIADASPHRQRS
jgi:hypothetical protein